VGVRSTPHPVWLCVGGADGVAAVEITPDRPPSSEVLVAIGAHIGGNASHSTLHLARTYGHHLISAGNLIACSAAQGLSERKPLTPH
jgi:hypothetical protein